MNSTMKPSSDAELLRAAVQGAGAELFIAPSGELRIRGASRVPPDLLVRIRGSKDALRRMLDARATERQDAFRDHSGRYKRPGAADQCERCRADRMRGVLRFACSTCDVQEAR